MPAHSTRAVCKESVNLAASCSIAVHNVKFGVSFWTSTCGMDVVTTKVGTKLKLLLGWDVGEILVTESYDLTLGNEKGELVSSCSRELAQLDTSDLGSNAWSEFLNLAAFRKEVFESGVCVFAVFNVVEKLQRRILLSVIPRREVLWVLQTSILTLDKGNEFTLASVFPPSRSICLFTFGVSSAGFATMGTIFSEATTGVSSGSC